MRTMYREAFQVRSYETDPQGRLQVPILCQLLQEAATAHAAILAATIRVIDSGLMISLSWSVFAVIMSKSPMTPN